MVELALLCSQVTLIIWTCWLAARVRRLSALASAATNAESAPSKWESKLRELTDEVVSLSSSYEKAQKQLLRLNSRAGMRELRLRDDEDAPPKPGASKGELRRYYGLAVSGPDFASRQLSIIPKE